MLNFVEDLYGSQHDVTLLQILDWKLHRICTINQTQEVYDAAVLNIAFRTDFMVFTIGVTVCRFL